VINLENIISIGVKYKDFISSKISLFLHNGDVVELHVPHRKKWIYDIGNAIKELKKEEDKNWDVNKIINTREINHPLWCRIKQVIQVILFALLAGSITYFLLQ
jgi:hypothetical protein